MLAALYARVSTPHQEQEATIDSQIAALEAFASQHDYALRRELYFIDQAVSGSHLNRPALDRLRDAATEGLIQVVLCQNPDRLARKFSLQSVILDELRRVGVSVIFLTQPDAAQTPQAELLLSIQGVFAEYERALITERLRRGKLYRIRHGQIAIPVAPYGYRYLAVDTPGGSRWVINEQEAAVVRQVYLWYTQDPRLTIAGIVQRLTDLGAAAAPRGAHWQRSAVQAMLSQPAYSGSAVYNRTRVCSEAMGQPRQRGHGVRRAETHLIRPSEEWIMVPVPALISDDLYRQAQEKRVTQRHFASRNNRQHTYLLRGLLVCGVCGHTLVGRTARGRVSYACAYGGRRRSPDSPEHRCTIAGSCVEPLVWEAITALLRQPELISAAWMQQEDTQSLDQQEGDRLHQRAKALTRQWDRLLDLFQDGQIEKDALVRRKERLMQEQQSIEQRLQLMTLNARQEQAKEEMVEDFAAFCAVIERRLDEATPTVQQSVIRLLIDHIIVNEGEIVIRHIIPTDDLCRLRPGRRRIPSSLRRQESLYSKHTHTIARGSGPRRVATYRIVEAKTQ